MPTFLLLLFLLIGRFTLAIVRGVGHLVLLPARTALAVAPHIHRPRWVLVSGVLATLGLATTALAILFGTAR